MVCGTGLAVSMPMTPRIAFGRTAFVALALVGCSAELGAEPSDQSEDGIRDTNGNEVVTSTTETFLKTSPDDSSNLDATNKCRIPKGTKVSLKSPRATNMMKCVQSCRLPMQPLHGFQILDCGGTA
jgi:hypothetical protein